LGNTSSIADSFVPTSRTQLSGLRAWLRALGPSSRPIFILAWCPLADMTSPSRTTTYDQLSGLRAWPRALGPSSRPTLILAGCPLADMTSPSRTTTYDQLSALRAWLRALGPSSRPIIILAWCPLADMTSPSKTTTYDQLSGLRAWLRALGPSLRPIFILAWCPLADVASPSKTPLCQTLDTRTGAGPRRSRGGHRPEQSCALNLRPAWHARATLTSIPTATSQSYRLCPRRPPPSVSAKAQPPPQSLHRRFGVWPVLTQSPTKDSASHSYATPAQLQTASPERDQGRTPNRSAAPSGQY